MDVVVRVVPFGANTGAKHLRGLSYNDAIDLQRRLTWPAGWPIPDVGQAVHLPEPGAAGTLYVRGVSWYPMGDADDSRPAPFVYLVLGDRP